jgi:hypothetical protein
MSLLVHGTTSTSATHDNVKTNVTVSSDLNAYMATVMASGSLPHSELHSVKHLWHVELSAFSRTPSVILSH